MNMVKTLVAASIAASFFGAAASQAATVSTPSTAAAPAAIGLTIVNETVRTVISPAATVVTLAAGESLSVDDSITFTLTAGTFAAIAAGDLTVAPNVGGATFALVSGGAGQNFATYRVTTAATDAAAVLTLAATATINGSAVANNGAINTTVSMSGFVGGVATSLFGSPLTSLTVAMVPMMSVTSVATTGTFDVATGYQQLLAASSADVAAPFDDSNAIGLTTTANAATAAGTTTAGVPAATPVAGATLFTISGPMTGVDSIIDGTTGLITSSTATGGVPAAPGTVANNFFIDTANNMAYAVGAGGHAPGVADVQALTMNFSTTTSHDISTYTVTVTTAASGSYAASTVGTTTLATFGRNGSAFTSNSVGSLNKLTITDRSGNLGGTGAADGAITITAFDAAGAAVTCTGLAPAALASNSTTTVQGSDITTACPGAKRVEGTVNSNSILVTNTKITSDGATSTPGLSSGGATSAN